MGGSSFSGLVCVYVCVREGMGRMRDYEPESGRPACWRLICFYSRCSQGDSFFSFLFLVGLRVVVVVVKCMGGFFSFFFNIIITFLYPSFGSIFFLFLSFFLTGL